MAKMCMILILMLVFYVSIRAYHSEHLFKEGALFVLLKGVIVFHGMCVVNYHATAWLNESLAVCNKS